ncbi:ATP--guanido phosphotransferase, partial [Robertmurraya sp. DFI.2.37]|nr:ATP--guanido phosphotransferase [Robertmurraya sp. DFI.2.37]
SIGTLELLVMDDLQPLQKRVLVEKHLISPYLEKNAVLGACILSENEEVSIMVNEEDHIRIQCLFPGLQISEAMKVANEIDDHIEKQVDYAYDEQIGY